MDRVDGTKQGCPSRALEGSPAAARETMTGTEKLRRDLLAIYRAALERVDGRACVRRQLETRPPGGAAALVAIGKAACAMAQGALEALGEGVADALVITARDTLDGALRGRPGVEILEGGHPEPTGASLAAGETLVRFIDAQPAGRPLLFLVSGGAPSLVELPRPGLTLDDLRRAEAWLHGSGLGVAAMNRLRRRLSLVKGGALMRFIEGRRVTGLFISDEARDDPAAIGGGLLATPAGDGDEPADRRLPDWLAAMTAPEPMEGVEGAEIDVHIVATLRDAREAAAAKARALGYGVTVSHAMILADAENSGRRLGLELLDAWPGVYVWGGKPGAALPAQPGRGGRAQQLALSAARVMEGRDDVCLLAAATDGLDGRGEDAGALVDGGTLGRARRAGFDAGEALARADAGTLLEAAGDLVRTGPTGSDVRDLFIGGRL